MILLPIKVASTVHQINNMETQICEIIIIISWFNYIIFFFLL